MNKSEMVDNPIIQAHVAKRRKINPKSSAPHFIFFLKWREAMTSRDSFRLSISYRGYQDNEGARRWEVQFRRSVALQSLLFKLLLVFHLAR